MNAFDPFANPGTPAARIPFPPVDGPELLPILDRPYRDGRVWRRLGVCGRCSGKGHLGRGLRPVAYGTCFRCHGSGVSSYRCRKDGTPPKARPAATGYGRQIADVFNGGA